MKKFDSVKFGKKISQLMRMLGKNQTEIAEEAGLSRVSLNRFLHGQSELRLFDFIAIMRVMGIDIEQVISDRLAEVTDERAGKTRDIGPDMEFVMNMMPRLGKQSYLGYLISYAELMGAKVPKSIYQRIRAEYETTI